MIWKDFNESMFEMQYNLDMLHVWCRANLLEINASKTKRMYLTTHNQNINAINHTYRKPKSGSTQLDFIQEYKYLGVAIDMNLMFAKHCYDFTTFPLIKVTTGKNRSLMYSDLY